MAYNVIRCGILGAQDQDLSILSALHNRENIQIAFVYDRDPNAVGIEIAEILGVPRLKSPAELKAVEKLDYVVVSEPRQRFTTELEVLAKSDAKLLNPADTLTRFSTPHESKPPRTQTKCEAPTIDDTLVALERLLDRKELLKFLLEVAVSSASANAGSIMLYSPETNDLYIAYAIGLSERVIKRTRQSLGKGIAGDVALKKQARLVETTAGESIYDKDRERMDIRSAISVPLLWGDRLLGVLNVSTDSSGRQLDANDLNSLKNLSRRISKVLFQSIKLEEAQMQHREWRFRSAMGEIASKRITAREKFSVLSKYLAELVGADTVDIYLNTAEGDWFVLGGSNRVISPRDRRLRYQRGALSRSFLENRCIILTEGLNEETDLLESESSIVFCPHNGKGVIALEFSERFRLDEFLLIKDAIVLEVSRFLGAELREQKLARELRSLSDVSTTAPAVLSCRSIESLAETLAELLGKILECEYVSLRLRESFDGSDYHTVQIPAVDDDTASHFADDEERFLDLARNRKMFSTAFLSFEPVVREEGSTYRSVLAYPIEHDGQFLGGVIAYNKNPADPLEDAVFSEQDRKVVANATALATPVLISMLKERPADTAEGQRTYQSVLEENLQRLLQIGHGEIQRSDRYHHAFTLLLFRVRLLGTLFENDSKRALALVDDITRGLETRTRKTDYGTWISRDTYAILTLEGGNRIRFLVGRVLTYLGKDLSAFDDLAPADKQVLVGSAGYPGTAKTPEDLITEATGNLKTHPQA